MTEGKTINEVLRDLGYAVPRQDVENIAPVRRPLAQPGALDGSPGAVTPELEPHPEDASERPAKEGSDAR